MVRTADGTLLPPLDALDRSTEEDDSFDLDRAGESGGRSSLLRRKTEELAASCELVDLAGLGGPSAGTFMKLR